MPVIVCLMLGNLGCYHGFDIMSPNSKVGKAATKFLIRGFKFAVENFRRKQP